MAELDKNILSQLDNLLSSTSLDDVNSETSGYEELKNGYYLSEVEKAELTVSKSSGNPMVSFMMNVVENGIDAELNGDDEITKINVGGKGRKIFLYFPLKDESSIKRFASNMLKFEDSDGESILPKEAFTTSETLEDALDIITGMRVYVQITNSEKDGQNNVWRNLISWKRARALELPE